MRRKSERTAGKKTKSPEKKLDKVKRTRNRRRKQSSSSDNESGDDTTPVTPQEVVPTTDEEKKPPGTPAKEESPGELDQVWQVKAAEGGDGGEIQKLKICLTRPPSTPERVDRSPRSKRKHSRATSSSDTPSNEGVDERKKSKHRSKRSTRESKDDEKNHDSQEEVDADADSQIAKEKSDCGISQSSDNKSSTVSDDTPMSTTNEDVKETESNITDHLTDNQESQNKEVADTDVIADTDVSKTSDADTTVASPKVETTVVTSDTEINKPAEQGTEDPSKDTSEDKSEVLEIHEDKCESSDTELNKSQTEVTREAVISGEKAQTKEATEDEVSKTEDKSDKSMKTVCDSNEDNKSSDETHVVESCEKTVEVRNLSVETSKDAEEQHHETRKELERSMSTSSTQEDNIQNGSTAPIVISRKRRWGSRPTKVTKQKSITISTDILKEIIPDVKPVEFDEVIEEKKPRREVTEKIERPVLPKIVIDNTENIEQNKKVNEEKERDIKPRDSHLSSNRKISIVKENDSIISRPPSPPRYKQSCILFITNLVRPFTLPQLKNLLQRTGRIVEDGFWIDRIKSKCYIKYETEEYVHLLFIYYECVFPLYLFIK